QQHSISSSSPAGPRTGPSWTQQTTPNEQRDSGLSATQTDYISNPYSYEGEFVYNTGQSGPSESNNVFIETPVFSNATQLPPAETPENASQLEPHREDLLSAIPNLFRLLDLVDEHGSGGIVEKIVIDQQSLHRLLNIVQPGSYDSVSKIDFRALDQLSIQPTGVYGNRSEIIKFLEQVHFLDTNSATLLSQTNSSNDSTPLLRSGLYLALDPNHHDRGTSKAAYIIYWPEETTWDDRAASSSVRRNRVTFMRYLNKLADQVISLVSSSQARAFIWDTSAHNMDLPEGQQETEDDARLFDFEVTRTLEQNEDVNASPGFTAAVESRLLLPGHDQANARVRLVPGEQKTALLVVRNEEEQPEVEYFNSNISPMNLKMMIESKDCSLQLGNISSIDLDTLAAHGLRNQHRSIFAKYDARVRELDAERLRMEGTDKRHIEERVLRDRPKIREEIQHLVRLNYDEHYPSLRLGLDVSHGPDVTALLHQHYPSLNKVADEVVRKHKPDVVSNREFQLLKGKWDLVKGYLEKNPNQSEAEQRRFIESLLTGTHDQANAREIPQTSTNKSNKSKPNKPNKSNKSNRSSWRPSFSAILPNFRFGDSGNPPNATTNPQSNSTLLSDSTARISDPEFVSQLQTMQQEYSSLSELSRKAHDALGRNLEALEKKVIADQLERVVSMEQQRQNTAASGARDHGYQEGLRRELEGVLQELREAMASSARQMRYVDWIRSPQAGQRYGHLSGNVQYRWGGRISSLRPAQNRHSICPLELTEQDSQLCRADEAHVPQPKVDTRHKFEFTLPRGRSVEFIQLVREKCLVAVSERGKTRIFIEDNVTIHHAVNTTHGKVSLNHDSLGGSQCKFAFDQATRLLAIVHGKENDLKLSIYIFDETFTNLRSRGSPISLKIWYNNRPIELSKVCFVSGLEEVCLLETSGRVRIFSLVTQQFRAASLQIDRPIVDAFSAPDGSCLLVIVPGDHSTSHRLLAFHWASFGSNKRGIDSTGLDPCDGYRVATRFDGRGRVHVVSFHEASRAITSTILQITQKATEFAFRSDREHSRVGAAETVNNSLIDCHLEVWTRFPVVPAVARNTLKAIDRQPRQLAFASPGNLQGVEEYFARMISTFETTTRKPMGGTLTSIEVKATNEVGRAIVSGVSEFKLGSFIVELLCLIPLHLAVTRENRFIPLKDGVWDPEYERSLLGADVPAIVDALSLGWYESLLKSYMATKVIIPSAVLSPPRDLHFMRNQPVRVVSSMGEQSVGKSYCLNHFADTSFAGSAMRTTEGVWLSCTPTEKYLLVSLDFEGVHSIERSAQEDALLVLFNTAISNLVLFRNNFAMSRDIAGLFTSFQSSATVLDPNVNRGLFNSTLAIIIKDVTNADSRDIVREFSLKFQGIVERERDQNFITRLHRGRIQIIPWPVINSPNFYTLFGRLHQRLDQQPFTHGGGGAFLHNLKTLMAKIKTSDWGSMNQNVAAHRAQQLLERLPNALSHGRHEEGPLKARQLYFDSIPETLTEQALRALAEACEQTMGTRHQIPDTSYAETLQNGIYDILDQRLALVQKWVNVNIERFPSGNQDIRNLTNKLHAASLGMRNAVRLCSSGCSDCQLLCLRAYGHSGEHSCETNHQCILNCDVEEHSQLEPCGLPAGHGGRHMCDIRAHSCGLECHLSGKGGCAVSCIKPLDHEGEHICSARAHICGKPCDLRNVMHESNGVFSCPGSCVVPWDEQHERHACDNARACPIECILCRRLCCSTDHFHGLDTRAVHLCGQEHNCGKFCESDGICQIETRPSAIQEQFSGQHESFMYTRFTQVDRRLSCVIPIPPGELSHEGAHAHDTGENPFHFCDVRCPNCEYLCGLPFGHGQQLHDTSHGSMITTQWVLQPDRDDTDPVYELQGRKFGSGDDGAPMLCNLVCAAQGRHAHIDYCRDPGGCLNTDCEHITERMHPDPDRAKDWVSHTTFWARSGFKDPYPQEEQSEFSKCDVLCAGPEHEASATAPANPSYCTLPIFHASEPRLPAPSTGHVSIDGHSFDCRNPARNHQAYHIVFVIDSSGSMSGRDRQPLPDTPISARLISESNNRYGAVLSALHGFWLSREAAVSSAVTRARQDAYSVITFASSATTRVENDFTSTTDQLISHLLPLTSGGTNFNAALMMAQSLIERHWSSDRAPVIVFLSDGECNVGNNTVYDLCHLCVRLGKALAFHSVSFGQDVSSASLRRMADIAREVFASAPQDVLTAARGNPCAYTNAIDTIQLADTFLGIASSLQKPRASLMNQFGSGGR
ncbi:unnamed protein product, partial [Rhizoctonia solani]